MRRLPTLVPLPALCAAAALLLAVAGCAFVIEPVALPDGGAMVVDQASAPVDGGDADGR